LPLGDPQHFGDRAFYKLPVGLCRLSDIIHCPLYKALRFRKKRPDESDIPAQGVSKFPNSSSSFGPSGCPNRVHKVRSSLRLPTF
jgi:hypothetical protein